MRSSVTAIDLRLGLLVGLGLSNGDGVSDGLDWLAGKLAAKAKQAK